MEDGTVFNVAYEHQPLTIQLRHDFCALKKKSENENGWLKQYNKNL